ncbi:RNA polymerase-associated protein LEO1-like isoform X2 [Corticium candelabrum]|uniref:RNA polymerase-associated protein LEO1-like isoform X2 n=1 Tax=Corticium candelabrum TaxID=121492 RepID=UPI002E26E204|nr:RNA polymerase-associated protein LEO1-like isoform X2 [Corticium candelabrum]
MKASPIKCYPLLEDNEYARYMKVLEEEEQVKRMEMEHQESEVLNKQTSLPFDSGFSDYDMDSEPFYEPGDEDAAARKHEADYDRRHKYSSTPLTETMKTNWLKKILSLKNGEEDTSEHESISNNDDGDSGGGDGDEDDDDDEDGGDGSLKMNKVVKKVMNLLSELKDNDKKEIADEEKMENRQGDKGKKKTNSGYDSNKVPGDSNNWKVRVRKMAQEETDHEMVEDEEEEKHLEITEALNKMKKKLENMIMQKLKEAGVRTEGEVKVKFVTATDAYSLSGDDGLHHLSDEETEELQELFIEKFIGQQRRCKEGTRTTQ